MKKFYCRKCKEENENKFYINRKSICKKCFDSNRKEYYYINNYKTTNSLKINLIKLNKKINIIECKYNIKVIDINIGNNYVKIEDEHGYQYETTYYGLKFFKKSTKTMTKDSYIRKYIVDNNLENTKYKILDIKNDKINILNTDTNISIWQSKYNFNKKAVDSLTEKHLKYIKIIKDRFGEKYDYSKLEYNGFKSEAILTCANHGDFKIKWANLLKTSHQGCPKCTHIDRKFGKKGFINSCNKLNVEGTLYFIKAYDLKEKFYKIGITTNINNRLNTIPYTTEIVLTLNGDPESIYNFEKLLHKKLTSNLYIPIKKFNGKLECFKFENEEIIKNIILEFSNNIL